MEWRGSKSYSKILSVSTVNLQIINNEMLVLVSISGTARNEVDLGLILWLVTSENSMLNQFLHTKCHFIQNWISVTLSRSTLVSEFKNDVDFVLTKRCLDIFKINKVVFRWLTHCICPNREKTVQTKKGWERMRMGENGSKINTKKTSCYKILPRKYEKIQTV